jgi:hypothetical protein
MFSESATRRRYLQLQRQREKALLACTEVARVHGLEPIPDDVLHQCIEELVVEINQEWGAVTPIGTQNPIVHRIMTLATQRMVQRREQEQAMMQAGKQQQPTQDRGTQRRALPLDTRGQIDPYQAILELNNERHKVAQAMANEQLAQKQNEMRVAMVTSTTEKYARDMVLKQERAEDARRCEMNRLKLEQFEKQNAEAHAAHLQATRLELAAFERAEIERKAVAQQQAQQERAEYLEIFRLQHEKKEAEERCATEKRKAAAKENQETLADQLRLRNQMKQREQEEDQRMQIEREAVLAEQELRKQKRLDMEAAVFARRLGMGTELFTSSKSKQQEEEERLARHCREQEERLQQKHEAEVLAKQRARAELLSTLEGQIQEKRAAEAAELMRLQEEQDRFQNQAREMEQQDAILQQHNAQMTMQFHNDLRAQIESDKDRRLRNGGMHNEEMRYNSTLLSAYQNSEVILPEDRVTARAHAINDRQSLLRNTGLRTIY